MKAFSSVEGSCAILGEGKILERGMGEMFIKKNFFGGSEKKLNIFFLWLEGRASYFLD